MLRFYSGRFVVVRGEVQEKGARRRFLIARTAALEDDDDDCKLEVHWHYPEESGKLETTRWLPVVVRGKPHVDSIYFETVWLQFDSLHAAGQRLPDDVIAFLREERLI